MASIKVLKIFSTLIDEYRRHRTKGKKCMSVLLKAHMDVIEQSLLAKARISANTGHPLHKGTPREAFIKEFLIGHLSKRVAIGHGEIIDASSKPNEPRNQMDIVLYKQ